MSKESYIRGFCKAAEAHGVDPQALAKFAQDNGSRVGPTREAEMKRNWLGIPETMSTPTAQQYESLWAIDPTVLARDTAGLSMRDYMASMAQVNPQAAAFFMRHGRRMPGFGPKLDQGLPEMASRTLKRGPVYSHIPGIENLNYATTTNLLNSIGKKTGRPIWDVAKAAPTAYGMGLEQQRPDEAPPEYPSERTGWDLMAENPESAYLDNPRTRELRGSLKALAELPNNSEHNLFNEQVRDIPEFLNNTKWKPAESNALMQAGWKFPSSR